MGGMQVLQWAASFPERLFAAIPIATGSRHSSQNIAFHTGHRTNAYVNFRWNMSLIIRMLPNEPYHLVKLGTTNRRRSKNPEGNEETNNSSASTYLPPHVFEDCLGLSDEPFERSRRNLPVLAGFRP